MKGVKNLPLKKSGTNSTYTVGKFHQKIEFEKRQKEGHHFRLRKKTGKDDDQELAIKSEESTNPDSQNNVTDSSSSANQSSNKKNEGISGNGSGSDEKKTAKIERWILEDDEKQFEGEFDADKSSYVLLVSVGSEFHVIPVQDQWISFRPRIIKNATTSESTVPITNRKGVALTATEIAEKQMKKWEQKFLKQEEKLNVNIKTTSKPIKKEQKDVGEQFDFEEHYSDDDEFIGEDAVHDEHIEKLSDDEEDDDEMKKLMQDMMSDGDDDEDNEKKARQLSESGKEIDMLLKKSQDPQKMLLQEKEEAKKAEAKTAKKEKNSKSSTKPSTGATATSSTATSTTTATTSQQKDLKRKQPMPSSEAQPQAKKSRTGTATPTATSTSGSTAATLMTSSQEEIALQQEIAKLLSERGRMTTKDVHRLFVKKSLFKSKSEKEAQKKKVAKALIAVAELEKTDEGKFVTLKSK